MDRAEISSIRQWRQVSCSIAVYITLVFRSSSDEGDHLYVTPSRNEQGRYSQLLVARGLVDNVRKTARQTGSRDSFLPHRRREYGMNPRRQVGPSITWIRC